MERLTVRNSVLSVTKQKAMEDAKKMQQAVQDECTKAGKEVPPYLLQELIGKGSFGRVYKATDLKSKSIVAVKIIDIEESDTLNPKLADTYSEFMKEISALKLLSDSGAKNINLILDALPVGQSMWMVTEYCAGGSVATLMKPTAPGGLQEKWIIPIIREVAVAVYWVHKEGIIHRDIKCANVLVTEAGSVQLCDFGVAGVIETKIDKRSTFIGTPHWMAPELFDPVPSYSTPVDIWAFGSLVYEIASGLPPNVMSGFNIPELGEHIKTNEPRLEGDQYSHKLKDLVSFCLVNNPAKRPTIEQVQRHPYISNTEAEHPALELANLVKGYKVWEAQGGVRKSLFAPVGAQGPSDYSSTSMANDEWNFSTTVDFDRIVMNTDAQTIYDVYGSNVDFDFNDQLPRPTKPKSRRRPPPQLPAFKAPLEKLFDPNTISNYEENSRAYYGKPVPPPASTSDLPLREHSLHSTLRESLIDLDMSLHNGGDLSQFVDMETIKAGPRVAASDSEFEEATDYNKPPLSDPADGNRRATQDWKFPSMAPPASANPDMSRFPFHEAPPMPRPALMHHPTDPLALQPQSYDLMPPKPQDNRASVGSLIDLDEIGMPAPDYPRPSTAHSDVGSIAGSDIGGANPFDLERHSSFYQPPQTSNREPSIYISDDSEYAHLAQVPDPLPQQRPMTDFSSGSNTLVGSHLRADSYDNDFYAGSNDYMDPEYLTMGSQAGPPTIRQQRQQQQRQQPRSSTVMPPLPGPPSARVMQGMATRDELREDVMRLMASFLDHLNFADAHVSTLPLKQGRNGGQFPPQ